MTPRERLAAGLLELADRGQTTPCQDRRGDRWTSDDHQDRKWAASVCVSYDCPVLDDCRDTGAEEKHKTGVWGGINPRVDTHQTRSSMSRRHPGAQWPTHRAKARQRSTADSARQRITRRRKRGTEPSWTRDGDSH